MKRRGCSTYQICINAKCSKDMISPQINNQSAVYIDIFNAQCTCNIDSTTKNNSNNEKREQIAKSDRTHVTHINYK